MNKEKIANIIGVSVEELDNNSKYLSEINATYYFNSERGGISIIVAEDNSYLAATSSVNFDELVNEFKNGRRNGNLDPIQDFINKAYTPDSYWGDKIKEFFESLTIPTEEEKIELIKMFNENKELYNEFTKELTGLYNADELFSKYMNKE